MRRTLNVADDIDVANYVILRAAEERTAQIRASLQGDGQEECEDCLAVIPEARRAAIPSAIRCAPCQHVEDLRGRAYR